MGRTAVLPHRERRTPDSHEMRTKLGRFTSNRKVSGKCPRDMVTGTGKPRVYLRRLSSSSLAKEWPGGGGELRDIRRLGYVAPRPGPRE
jgi:hypothetical protein